jgi:hypothetical protein
MPKYTHKYVRQDMGARSHRPLWGRGAPPKRYPKDKGITGFDKCTTGENMSIGGCGVREQG